MVCRSTSIGSAMTSWARLDSHLEEQQTLSVFHQLVREGHAAPAPSAVDQLEFVNGVRQRVRTDSTLSDARRRSIMARLDSAATTQMDGRTYYAANRIVNRSTMARDAYGTYAERTCRDLGQSRAELDVRVNGARAAADADRSLTAPRQWLSAFREGDGAGLPLDRQTAYAVHLVEQQRAHAVAGAQHRRAVHLTPVNSSVIRAMGYNPELGRAEVELHSRPGQPYAYRVPAETMTQWQAQSSLGSYWSRNIRGHEQYQYGSGEQSQAETFLTRCGTCGQFAGPSHSCPIRGSVAEQQRTLNLARQTAMPTTAANVPTATTAAVTPEAPAATSSDEPSTVPEPQYLERGYRAFIETWGRPRSTTAADVVEYEQGELENELGINQATIEALRGVSHSDVTWVTANATDADQYAFDGEGEPIADVERCEWDRPALVLATDGDGGYLVLTTADDEAVARVLAARAGTPAPVNTPVVVPPVEVEPVRVMVPNGQTRVYRGADGGNNFRTLNATGLLQRARQAGGTPVRLRASSTIRYTTGPDGARTHVAINTCSGDVDITYNGRGRGYTVTAATNDRDRQLQCHCPDYRTNYSCIHTRQTIADMNTRLNQASIRDPHQPARIETASAVVAGNLARDYADSREAQTTARTQWGTSEVSYGQDYTAFRTEYQAARARRDAGEQVVPYMTENATDGLGARDGGRAFGVEVEFDLNPGVNRTTALAAIGRDLHAAGLTTSAYQRGYGATHGVYREEQQGGWSFEQDPTVAGEIVSPAMFDEPETWANLQKVCDIVKAHGGTASTRAGQHIHVSAHNYDHTVENHSRLLQTFAENEDTVYRLSSNPDRGTHRGAQWCRPNNVPSSGYQSIGDARQRNNGHHLGVNMQSVSGRTQDHIEFRTFDSNLEPAVMQAQIKVSLAMTEAAFRDTNRTPEVTPATQLGSHRDTNRAANTAAGRQPGVNLTGAAWREDTQGFRSFVDRMFRRPEDKAQATALFAITKWQRSAPRGNGY
ncbi:MAG: amidoligase family protein [Propionicimonas sp.]